MKDQKHLRSLETMFTVIHGGGGETAPATKPSAIANPTPPTDQLAGGLLDQLSALADAIDQDIAVILGF